MSAGSKVFVRFPSENCKRVRAPSLQSEVVPAVKGKFLVSISHPNQEETNGQNRVLHRETVDVKTKEEAQEALEKVLNKNFKVYMAMDNAENDRAKAKAEKSESKYVAPPALLKESLVMSVTEVGKYRFEIEISHPTKTEPYGQRRMLLKQLVKADDVNEAFDVVNRVKNTQFKHIKTVYETPLPEQAKRAQEKSKAKKAA